MIRRFLDELKRRNVLRAMVLYIGAVWALAQGISQIGGSIGMPEDSTRWFLIASGIGFPFWLAFSWFYEFTSEGIRRESEIAPEARARQTHRKTDLVIIGVLTIAVVLLLTDRFFVAPPRQQAPPPAVAADNSIAVLPFDNGSGDKDQQYFSDGLSEGFIVALSRLDGLRVVDRKSSFQFRDSDEDSRQIAARLGVANLLDGSVRRSGQTVRISATLTRASDGSTLWAEQFDRPYQDLFALQDDVVAKVAQALQARLRTPAATAPAPEDRPPSGNLDAYNAYLQARGAVDRQTAIARYDQAIALDPGYALPHAWKARMLVDAISDGGLTGAAARDAYAQADASATAALRLAPGQAASHIARGWLLMLRDFNWSAGAAALAEAVRLAPNDGDALYMLGIARASQGDPAQAAVLTRRALLQDPMNAAWYQWLAVYDMALGQLDDAASAIAKAVELKPGAIYSHYLQTVLAVLRDDAAAATRAAAAEPDGPWHDFAVALATQLGGDRAAADASLRQTIDRHSEGWAMQVAQVQAARGDADAVFEWLRRAMEARDPGMQALLYEPLLQRFRADPRFFVLAREAGLPAPAPGRERPTSERPRAVGGSR